MTQCSATPATSTMLELPLRRKRASIDPDDADFSSPTWLKMLKDLDIPPFRATSPGATTVTCNHPLVQTTIAQVLKDGYLKKIPKLFAFVKSINLLDDCADAVIKDPTGEMKATIHANVLEEEGDNLTSGSCLVLRKVMDVISPIDIR
ncbi:hypothetical protein GUITHDRAFT_120910 [Guillardia theta CCMP2712]|uniref:Homologous recombination OB-fold protein OB-fold domain-containing protein n=1 Tax=Guillardia theta (strain CCMP2712) TaxID=905079 RepID=L1IAL8_GUITC|nr:hypothetical protein GUITHDRAFT_120910 [Guillardia theta CCMP2712]EKX32885.1 hypothetical protein GUITHDRAFT_120910 [Guillardia theta CCMP2712]|eukprot:XP_005819865.1 hypothetical protein GUITHDRAFT_120910 [Guillardia theta CCMP2712]